MSSVTGLVNHPTAREKSSDMKGCTSPVIASFQRYAALMKDSQDKYERLFKIRRDITIESKRVIFLLHSIDRPSKRESICAEAEMRLRKLIDEHYRKIAGELDGEDPYYYAKAISPGNEEFVEALTLLEYHQHGKIKGLISCNELPFLPTIDYILGIADLTGELMRRCVSNLGTGDLTNVRRICLFLREVHIGMLGVATGRELCIKMKVLEESLAKVERICYNLHIFGNENSSGALAFLMPDDNVDDGFHQ